MTKEMTRVIIIVIFQMICFRQQAHATDIRVYCKPTGIILEHRVDEIYNNENKTEDQEWFVINKDNIPAYKYAGQLRCSGASLVVDPDFKPDWVLKKEKREELESQLDQLLESENPDPVEVIRIQRKIQKIKEG